MPQLQSEQLIDEMIESLSSQKKLIVESKPTNMFDRIKLAGMHKIYVETCGLLYKLLESSDEMDEMKKKKLLELIAKVSKQQ